MDPPENSGRQTSDPHIHNLDGPRVTYRWLKTSSHPLTILLATSTMANNNPITIKVSSKTYVHHAQQQEATFHAFVGYEVFVKLVPEVHYSICLPTWDEDRHTISKKPEYLAYIHNYGDLANGSRTQGGRTTYYIQLLLRTTVHSITLLVLLV